MFFCTPDLSVPNIISRPNIKVWTLITHIIFFVKLMACGMILQHKDKSVVPSKLILPGSNWHTETIQYAFTGHVSHIYISNLFSPTTHRIQLSIRLLTIWNSRIGFSLPKCSSS